MILRRVAAIVVCVGCGRIGFDATTSTGDAMPAGDSPASGGSITIVQALANSTSVSSTLMLAISSTKQGNLLVALAGTTKNQMITSVTDNAGNTYVSAGAFSQDVNSGETDYYYCANATGGATQVTAMSDTTNAAMLFYEIAGARATSPLAQVNALSSRPASLVPQGAPVTTTVAGEVILTNADVMNAVVDLRPGAAFIPDAPAMTTDGAAHLVAATPGTYMASWDQSFSGTYATSTVAFFPAP